MLIVGFRDRANFIFLLLLFFRFTVLSSLLRQVLLFLLLFLLELLIAFFQQLFRVHILFGVSK